MKIIFSFTDSSFSVVFGKTLELCQSKLGCIEGDEDCNKNKRGGVVGLNH
jgi:hypothetical protein